MEATVKKQFIDSKQDNKLFRANQTWSGTKARFEEINGKIKGALVEGASKAAPETKERKTDMQVKATTETATASTAATGTTATGKEVTSAKATTEAKKQQAKK